MLAAVFDGNLEPIKTLILNRDADEFGRAAGVTALALLAAWAEVPRATIVDHLLWLATEGLEREPSQVWGTLAAESADIEALEVFPELRRAYDEGLIDPSIMHPSELDDVEAAPPGRFLEDTRDRHPPIQDVAEATEWWADFHPGGRSAQLADTPSVAEGVRWMMTSGSSPTARLPKWAVTTPVRAAAGGSTRSAVSRDRGRPRPTSTRSRTAELPPLESKPSCSIQPGLPSSSCSVRRRDLGAGPSSLHHRHAGGHRQGGRHRHAPACRARHRRSPRREVQAHGTTHRHTTRVRRAAQPRQVGKGQEATRVTVP